MLRSIIVSIAVLMIVSGCATQRSHNGMNGNESAQAEKEKPGAETNNAAPVATQKPQENVAASSGVAATSATPATTPQCYTVPRKDMRLSELLEKWTAQAGYQLAWEIHGEEPVLSATGNFCGKTFDQALDIVLNSYSNTTPIKAIFHRMNNVVQIVSGAN